MARPCGPVFPPVCHCLVPPATPAIPSRPPHNLAFRCCSRASRMEQGEGDAVLLVGGTTQGGQAVGGGHAERPLPAICFLPETLFGVAHSHCSRDYNNPGGSELHLSRRSTRFYFALSFSHHPVGWPIRWALRRGRAPFPRGQSRRSIVQLPPPLLAVCACERLCVWRAVPHPARHLRSLPKRPNRRGPEILADIGTEAAASRSFTLPFGHIVLGFKEGGGGTWIYCLPPRFS